MRNLFKLLTFGLSLALLATSCSSDDDSNQTQPLGDYENGIIVSAEGGPSSISFISNDLSIAQNNVYSTVNEEELGVYLQSIGFNGNQAFIVTDNTNAIIIVNRYTFEKEGSITTGLATPRYIDFANGKAYVSNWGDGFDPNDDFIAVVDLSSNTVETTIDVSEGPERILAENGKVYVSHKGGYGSNNVISVIDTANNEVSTISVGDVPDEMFVGDSGDLFVLSEGKAAWTGDETVASISKIDMSDNSVVQTLTFTNGVHPSQMYYDNGAVYYILNNEVFEMNEAATSLPTTSIVNLGTITAYGMAVNNGNLYITDAKDFASLGNLLVYDVNTGSLIDTFEVGVNPSKIYFN